MRRSPLFDVVPVVHVHVHVHVVVVVVVVVAAAAVQANAAALVDAVLQAVSLALLAFVPLRAVYSPALVDAVPLLAVALVLLASVPLHAVYLLPLSHVAHFAVLADEGPPEGEQGGKNQMDLGLLPLYHRFLKAQKNQRGQWRLEAAETSRKYQWELRQLPWKQHLNQLGMYFVLQCHRKLLCSQRLPNDYFRSVSLSA